MATEEETQVETETTEEGGQQADEGGQQADETRQGSQEETTPVERPSRRDRRQARIDVESANKDRDEWKRRFDETNGRYSDLERQFAALQARIDERERASQKDTTEAEIEKLEDEAQRHLLNVSQSKDPAYQRAEMKLYHAKQRAILRMEDKRERETEQRNAPRGPDQAEIARNTSTAVALVAEYPELQTNRFFQMRAEEHRQRLAEEKRLDPNSLSTLRAAVALAARDLGINGAGAKLPQGNRGRYGGVAAGEGDGDADEPSMPRFTGSEAEYRMARGLYPSDDEDTAYRKWKGDIISEWRSAQH